MLKNSAQEEVIRSVDGPVCVVAVPGSGKTTTLIRRIRHMTEQGIDAHSILVLTFSRSAARDMNERYRALYGINPGVVFSTIHAFCLNILKVYGGEKNIRVLTPKEETAFAMRAAGAADDKRKAAADILLDIGIFRSCPSRQTAFRPACVPSREQFDEILGSYKSFKEELGAIDFDDMLSMALSLLEDPAVLRRITDRFRYILVDEHQDTNELQWEIIRLLAGERRNICVVGDDDQSIYGFRGADPSIMLSFKKDFPEAKMICLRTNYRSDRAIIESAASLIGHNARRFGKSFNAASDKAGLAEIDLYPDRKSQLRAVARTLAEGTAFDDTAILTRTNEEGLAMAEELMAAGVPFFCREGLQNKYEGPMFRDFMAFIRAAGGDPSAEDVRRILSRPDRGLSHEAFTSCPFTKSALMKAASSIGNRYARISAKEAVSRLFSDLEALKGKPPRESLVFVGGRMGYRQYLALSSKRLGVDPESLFSVWESFQRDAVKCGNDWELFLMYAWSYGRRLKEMCRDERGVDLATLHMAKGRQWRRVFILDCVDGCLPFSHGNRPSDEEEERRLLYVGMTRAKEELHLCAYERGDRGAGAALSPFLKETGLPVIRCGDVQSKKGIDVRKALAESALF